jgi:CO/xanthine dehydrogenase FAD-binding subunit
MTYLRRLPKFEFVSPDSLAEVCALTADASAGEVMLLAGGTDAILQMRRRERTPRRVIGLKGVPELDFVREQDDGSLAIGAMTSLQTLLSAPLVRQRYGVLSETAAQIGGRELRNVATVGGNIAGALPCADMPPALMTLGARVRLSSRRGDRWVPLEEFFPEFGRTVALEGELLTEIRLPRPAPNSAGSYLKFHDRQSMDMTVVGVSAFVVRDLETQSVRDIRLAYANSGPTVFRARQAEAVLRGCTMSEEGLDASAAVACQVSNPRTSWRANADYRRELIRSLTKRAIRQAWQKAVPGEATSAQGAHS